MTPKSIENIKEAKKMAWNSLDEMNVIGKKIHSILFDEGKLHITFEDKSEMYIIAFINEQNIPKLIMEVDCLYRKTFRI